MRNEENKIEEALEEIVPFAWQSHGFLWPSYGQAKWLLERAHEDFILGKGRTPAEALDDAIKKAKRRSYNF